MHTPMSSRSTGKDFLFVQIEWRNEEKISSNNITATHTQNRMSSWLNFIVDAVESSIFTDGIRPFFLTTAAAESFGARLTDFTPTLRMMQPYQF